jgi:hypothetical protein
MFLQYVLPTKFNGSSVAAVAVGTAF